MITNNDNRTSKNKGQKLKQAGKITKVITGYIRMQTDKYNEHKSCETNDILIMTLIIQAKFCMKHRNTLMTRFITIL